MTEEGFWLLAEQQSAGKGRLGRPWASPPGNFYGSTLVRLRPGDLSPATLGFVAAVALAETVLAFTPSRDCSNARTGAVLKWPNDLLFDGAKLSGILLERAEDAVVVGIGVNLSHHPDLPGRRTTSLAEHGPSIEPSRFAEPLAANFARWLDTWRSAGFIPVRARWLALAHPPGTPLCAALPDGTAVEGAFETLDTDGALILRLADGARRSIHAGDVFLA